MSNLAIQGEIVSNDKESEGNTVAIGDQKCERGKGSDLEDFESERFLVHTPKHKSCTHTNEGWSYF